MQTDKLRSTVSELEREVRSLQPLDDDSRRLLLEAVAEIRAVLDEDQAPVLQGDSIIDRLKLSVEKFEGTHPTLTGTLSRVIDGLAQMGI